MNTDAKLKEALAAQLYFWVGRSTDDVQVSVSDGMVTLRGWVPTYAEKMECEETVRRTGGVKGVANKIVVKPAKLGGAEMLVPRLPVLT